MEMSKGELAHRAVAGALAAGKASAAAVRLRTALVSAANRAASRIRSERLAARQKANVAAQHSSQAIARHQKFIEQLINEKKTLAERIGLCADNLPVKYGLYYELHRMTIYHL